MKDIPYATLNAFNENQNALYQAQEQGKEEFYYLIATNLETGDTKTSPNIYQSGARV